MSNYITPCTDVLLMLDAEVAKRTTAPVLKSIDSLKFWWYKSTGGACHRVSSNLTLGVHCKTGFRVPE
jgi:hypothetical protein